ncbi:hypothetical protein BJ508DRAFT_301988 [Ascobolus immersus RN42]|uniref:Uncharacterized protein n=1 Tax=Ascobolus immersus RN42 TaxID=1160509 RepID=A0A3N4IMI6_ASCIM|nr:hypothetical protein BJ508DRAFT_301988 [Ascobolus immersus RN42]
MASSASVLSCTSAWSTSDAATCCRDHRPKPVFSETLNLNTIARPDFATFGSFADSETTTIVAEGTPSIPKEVTVVFETDTKREELPTTENTPLTPEAKSEGAFDPRAQWIAQYCTPPPPPKPTGEQALQQTAAIVDAFRRSRYSRKT